MAVMARETGTDERLDDLSNKVDQRFDRVEADIREVKGEVRNLRSQMNGRFERVDDEFHELRSEMNARFDSMQRTMILGFGNIVASIAASVIGGILATQL